MTQLDLLAHARTGDPDTSFIAARRASKSLTETQDRVLALLRMYGPLHDEALAEKFRNIYGGRVTEQSIRSRRSELTKCFPPKVVYDGTKATTKAGGPSRRWRAV